MNHDVKPDLLDELIPDTQRARFIRLPGLYRKCEIQDVIEAGKDFHFEKFGETTQGTELFEVYRREGTAEE